jgi:hypothetical protein
MEQLLPNSKFIIMRDLGVTNEMFSMWMNNIEIIDRRPAHDTVGVRFHLDDHVPSVSAWWSTSALTFEETKAEVIFDVITCIPDDEMPSVIKKYS